ncbi:MAG: hypothetical protein RLY86_247 [Pseudomonadota bacterium]|jgi:pimeloyl-ACP methyl ester carboxylesterase
MAQTSLNRGLNRGQGDFPGLAPALDSARREITGRAGRLSYYTAGPDRDRGEGAPADPVLLLHSINAAASAYEVRPIFQFLRGERPVYAPDLPGYGFSDRSDRYYDRDLFVAAVHDMLDLVRAEHPGRKVDVLALSLTAEFAARAIASRQDEVGRLVLVTPTGFDRRAAGRSGPPGGTLEMGPMARLLEGTGLGRALFRPLASRASIAYFLRRTFGGPDVPPDLVDYAWRTAHQPGGHHAPLAFLSFRLFSTDIRQVYERLTLPVWVPHATRGDFRDFSATAWAEARPNWLFQPYATGALPQFQMPDAFLTDLRRFLDSGTPALARAGE